MDPQTPQPVPRRTSRLAGLLVILAIAASAVAALIYQSRQTEERAVLDKTGFDLEISTGPAAPGKAAAFAQASRSGLGMVKAGMPGAKFGSADQGSAPRKAGGKVDQKAVMDSVMKNNPELRKAAEQR